jgi:hypothetical protein
VAFHGGGGALTNSCSSHEQPRPEVAQRRLLAYRVLLPAVLPPLLLLHCSVVGLPLKAGGRGELDGSRQLKVLVVLAACSSDAVVVCICTCGGVTVGNALEQRQQMLLPLLLLRCWCQQQEERPLFCCAVCGLTLCWVVWAFGVDCWVVGVYDGLHAAYFVLC